MEVAAITGSIVLDENPALKAEKAVVAGIRQMKNDVENANAEAAKHVESKWGETLHNIRSEFGKRSVFGESVELLAGAGVIGGVGLVAEKFSAVTGKIAESVDALREGKLTASEMTGELLREVPILGGITKGFDNIREAITGEKYAIELVNREAELTTKFFNDQAEAARKLRDVTREYADETARARAEAAEADSRDSLEKRVIGLRAQQEAQHAADERKLQEAIDAQRAAEKGVKDQQAIIANLKAQFTQSYKADPDNDPLNAFRVAGPGGILKNLPSYDRLAKQMEQSLVEIKDAENRQRSLAQQAAVDIQKVKDDAHELELAHDQAFNAKIMEAQRDAGREMKRETEEQTKKAADLRADAANEALRDFSRGFHDSRREMAAPARFEEMPSPVLSAEEISGNRVAGGKPEWVEVEKENTDTMKENTDALKTIAALLLRANPLVGNPVIAIQGGF